MLGFRTLVHIILGATLIPQIPPSQQSGTPAFETEIVRPANPLHNPIAMQFPPGRLVVTNTTLQQLILQSYGLADSELQDGPDWVQTERFDITATTEGVVPRDTVLLMLRNLLAKEFKLELAKEARTGTVYTLTARNPKVTPAAKPDEKSFVSSSVERETEGVWRHFDGHNAPISFLINSLQRNLQAKVLDATGLPGNYDFRVNYTADPTRTTEPISDKYPGIFAALESQMGLKLTAGKGDVTLYVIKNVSKPTP
jgi:uncharacterized protein (TIGR03435 family)